MKFSERSPILLVGLSGSGKTNYLVALDYLLDEPTSPDGLEHSEFAADRAYLQPLREQWLRGEELRHTSRQPPPPPHQLCVVHKSSNTRIKFHIPDLAGEVFDAHFVTRSFPLDYKNQLRETPGIMLFLHCDHESEHALLEDAIFIENDILELKEEKAEKCVVEVDEWKPELASKQVKLVDILQFIGECRRGLPALQVAVVISAWELVQKVPNGLRSDFPSDPALCFQKRWPLLSQYFESNHDAYSTRVFGVSARGGGRSPAEVKRLTAIADPRERILLIDGKFNSNDLTRPVRWLLGLLKESA